MLPAVLIIERLRQKLVPLKAAAVLKKCKQ